MSYKTIIRYCCSRLWNKQFLIFLFFLALSTVFWLFEALNEIYDREFAIPVELRNVPDNVVITTDLPPALHVTLRDRGSALYRYKYLRKFKPVAIDFHTYANASGHVTLPANELLKQITPQLQAGTQVAGIKPESLEFYYNYGLCKRVPVILQQRIRTGKMYSLADIRLQKDSVMVYASGELLDTITGAYTLPLSMTGLTDTTQVQAGFVTPPGVKFVPARVGVTFCIDRMVEKTVQVPVQQVNFPASKQLRTFPASVAVTFQVGMGMYRSITQNNFVIVVNYEDLLKDKNNKCRLSLKSVPTGVSHVRISPQEVEYIIEEISDTESDNDF